MIGPQSSLLDLAFAICTVLQNAGSIVILTGGGAAAAYAPESVRSHDVDFVMQFLGEGALEALESIGLARAGQHYAHPETTFIAEFLNPPLAILDDEIESWATIHRGAEILHLLHPEDCVKDRLAWFLAGSRIDYGGIMQAIAVGTKMQVDWTFIDSWVLAKGGAEKLATLRELRASR